MDEERAPLVRQAFELYATGDWTAEKLASHLNRLGLCTLATAKVPSSPITESYVYRILGNPYYTGVVRFQGVTYPGRHEPLTDTITWQRVQDILKSHNLGERTRKHPHYLRSTVYCGACGERLLVSMSRSKTGVRYPYFMCAGRHAKRNDCDMKAVLIYEVEDKLKEHYRRVQLTPEFCVSVKEIIREGLRESREQIEAEQRTLKLEKDKLERQQMKLLEAHYADSISVDLLGKEQARISRSLAEIESQMNASTLHVDEVEQNLNLALELAENIGRVYPIAPDHIKRQINQALFEQVLVVRDNGDTDTFHLEAELCEPFATLTSRKMKTAAAAHRQAKKKNRPPLTGRPVSSDDLGSATQTFVQSLSKKTVEGPTGIEPAFSAWEADVLPLDDGPETTAKHRNTTHRVETFQP